MVQYKKKLKLCDGCGEHKMIWKNHQGKKYCQYCWKRHSFVTGKQTVKPTNKHLPRRSPNRAKQEREYSKLRKEFLLSSPVCTARIPGKCTQEATDVHHKKGRDGDLLLDTTYWISLCRSCHDWVDLNFEAAVSLGLSERRI